MSLGEVVDDFEGPTVLVIGDEPDDSIEAEVKLLTEIGVNANEEILMNAQSEQIVSADLEEATIEAFNEDEEANNIESEFSTDELLCDHDDELNVGDGEILIHEDNVGDDEILIQQDNVGEREILIQQDNVTEGVDKPVI